MPSAKKKAAAKSAAVSKQKATTTARKAAASSRAAAKPPAKPKSASASAKAAPAKAATKAPAKAKAGSTKAVTKAPAKAATKAKAKGPAPSAAFDKKFLEAQEAKLNEERLELLHQADVLRAEAEELAADMEPGDVQFDEESGEGATIAVERLQDLALSAQARAAVEEIDAALAKIADGSYGLCEMCGNKIPKERLRFIPHASLCVACKSSGFAAR